jgi:hypothetical protein
MQNLTLVFSRLSANLFFSTFLRLLPAAPPSSSHSSLTARPVIKPEKLMWKIKAEAGPCPSALTQKNFCF